MIIIWKGHGLFVLAALAGSVMLWILLGFIAFRPENFEALPEWFVGLGFLPAGLFLWWWGRILNSPTPPNPPDRAKKLGYVPEQRHSLYFVPIQYWGAVFLALGVYSSLAAVLS